MCSSLSRRTVFKRGTVVTLDAEAPYPETADVLVEGNRVAAIGTDIAVDDAEVIDAHNAIVMPGLVDAHHRAWLSLTRRMLANVDDLFDLIAVAEVLGSAYRPIDMHVSTRLAALSAIDAGITTIVDACDNSRSPEHTDAALDALASTGIRALHMVGAPMDKQASALHLPHDLERLAGLWSGSDAERLRIGLFGQLDLDAWKVARRLNLPILTEFIPAFAQLGPEFAEHGVLLGDDNILNHCTRLSRKAWKLLGDANVRITVTPRSDALLGLDDESFAYQQAVDHGLRPALGVDFDTSYGSDLFGEMHALFLQQRSSVHYRKLRGETDVAVPISVEDVLKAATINGARVAGLERTTGTLAPGKQADIVMVRTGGIGVFPATDAIGTIVQAVGRGDVDTVMIAGRFCKRAGKLVDVDMAKLLCEVSDSCEHLREATGRMLNPPADFARSPASPGPSAHLHV